MEISEIADSPRCHLIDGKGFAAKLRTKIAEHVERLKTEHSLTPGLAVVLVGDDPASQVYVRNKKKMTIEAGMHSFEHNLPASTTKAELLELINQLNHDPSVNGILVQLPLPNREDEEAIIQAIEPDKDVDGFHYVNAGKLATWQDGLVPCTPLGCLMLLKDQLGDLKGKHAVVMGRSGIVGRPMSQLLLREACTTTVVHRHSHAVKELTKQADILVTAIGKPELITGDWIKPGATVIDVGINRIENPDGTTRLVGDVERESALFVAEALTPVPGGVGPMTIACLLYNTLKATCRQRGLEFPLALS
jgi:methylenetetrahydrofolate dehydrogenase (NADP+)/methenyltetrahydrofolate cyclohydrolase